ncbi:MAG: hypothetical protein WCG16_04010 [Methylococcales bacterium]
MATLFVNNLISYNSTTAQFRLWCTFVHNVFMLGFINVTDSGQIDLTNTPIPGQRTYQGKINISLECLHFLTDYQYKARNFQLITIDNSNMYRIWVGVPIFSSPLPTIITTG